MRNSKIKVVFEVIILLSAFALLPMTTLVVAPSIDLPTVTTNDATNVEETTATLTGNLTDDGGEECTVSFEYGQTTSYGNTTGNQFATNGTTFNSTILGKTIRPTGGDNFEVALRDGLWSNTYDNNNETYARLNGNQADKWCKFTFSPAKVVNKIWFKANGDGGLTISQINVTAGITWSTVWTGSLVWTDGTVTNNITFSQSYEVSEMRIKVSSGLATIPVWYETWLNETLSPGTLYHYRAVANNSNSTAYGSDKIFLTKPYAVTGFTAAAYSSTRIDLNWTNHEGGNGVYVEYAVNSSPSPWNPRSGTKINVTGYVPGTSVQHTGLTPGLHYYYKAWAFANDSGVPSNGSATKPFGDNPMIYNVVLRTEYIPGPPSDFNATAYNRTQINLTWTNAGTNNTYIEWNTAEHWAIGAGTEIYNGTGTSYEHTDLSPGTTYYYQAWSWNETDSKYSLTNTSGNDTTLANTLPALSGFTVANGSTVVSMSLFWNATIIDADGDTFNWTMECNNSQDDGANGASNGTKSLQLTGLDYSSSYNVWVNATDLYGTTSSWYTFTTRVEYAPDEPSSFTAATASNSQINLAWTKGDNASHTRVQRKTGSYPLNISDGTNVYNSTGTSHSNTELTAGTTYYYRAWGWNTTDKLWSTNNATGYNTTNNIGPPIIITNNATNITEKTATLNGKLIDDGGENCTVKFEYGSTTSYGNTLVPYSPYLSTYIHAGGETTFKVYKYWQSNMTKKAESASCHDRIMALAEDETYIYEGGLANVPPQYIQTAVFQYWQSNMTKKAQTDDYGGGIYALAVDGTYVYVGGSSTNKVYQFWKSNMTKKAETESYGNAIYALAVDDTYVYAGGKNIQKVYQYWKSNMTKKAEGNYGASIRAITAEDSIYVYAGGNTVQKVHQYWKSNMTKKAQTDDYGGGIYALAEDSTYIYAGGVTTQKVYKYLKSDMSKVAETESYGGDILSIKQDSTYVYAGGVTTQKVYKYLKSDMSKVAETESYGGDIYAITLSYYYLTGNTLSYNLMGLTPGTLHHYRSVANNSVATSYGSDVAFLTKPNAPISFVAVTYNATQINLSWVEGIGSTRTIIERNASGQTVWSRGGSIQIYNDTGTRCNDTGLISNVSYYYQAWSYCNESGLHQFSDDFDSTCNITFGPPTVTTNDATNIGTTNATLNGYLNDDGGEQCTVGFQYGYTTEYENTTTNQIKTTGETFSANITGLSSGTLYHFRAKATNSNGTRYGSDMTFLTKPSEPSSFTASTCSPSRINLSWTNGTGATHTRIMQKTGSYPTSISDGSFVYNGTGTSANNASLGPGTKYYFRAWSWNQTSKLWSTTNADASNTTWSSPLVPTGFKATTVSSTQIALNWTKGTNATHTMIMQKMEDYPTSISDGSLTYNGTSATCSNSSLTAGTKYYFRAWSWNQTSKLWSTGNESASNTTNNLPTADLKNPSPNGTTNVNLQPNCQIFANDTDGDTLMICWYENSTGSYILRARYNNNVSANTTPGYKFTQFNSHSTKYYWKVSVNDSKDNITRWFNFTTRTEYIPSPPGDFNATAYNRTQINLTWTNAGSNSTVVERNIAVEHWARGAGTEIYTGADVSFDDTGLSPGTTYYYQAWSWNETDSKYSLTNTSGNDTTLANTLPALSGFTVANGSTVVSMSLFWNATIIDADGDTFNWTMECNNSQDDGANGASNGTKSLQLTGLDYSSSYNVWVNATDLYGTTSSWYTFTTRVEYAPDEPSSFTAATASNSQINLAWTKGDNASHTRVQRKTGSYPLNISDGTNVYNSTGTSHSNTELTAGTTYYYRAWGWNTTDKLWSTNNASANSTTNSGGSTPPYNPPYTPPYAPPPSGEEPTMTEEVEDLYDITLNEDFYANDTNGDGIADTFTDPNDILHNEHVVNINGNASFLISVDGDVDKLFIWDTEADTITQVTHNMGEIIDTVDNSDAKTITITVSVEKANWTYIEVTDLYPNNFNLIVKTSDGRTISSDIMWRENDTIYILDDPATEYLLIYSYEEKGFLFDVLLELTPDSVYVGQNITALITMINVGEPGMVNGTLNYTIYKGEEIVWSELENVSVLGQKAINKPISTKGLGVGEYNCEVVYVYGDNITASAHASFTIAPVPPQLAPTPLPPTVPIILAVVILSAFAVFLFRFLKKRRHAE